MKTNVQMKLAGFLIPLFLIFSSIFLTNCKGHVEIFDITDSVINCSPPYVVYFYPDAEHRKKDLEYTWTFGDGTESHDQEAVHTYTEHGIYEVTLSIKQNESFDSKTIPLYLTVDSTAPEANWSYYLNTDSLWAPAQVFYLNDSEHSTNFIWEFGDGDTSHLKVPAYHIFDTPGTYRTTLSAICSDDTSLFWDDMIIKPAPTHIYIYDVTLNAPPEYSGIDIDLYITYDGFDDEIIRINGINFPAKIDVNEYLSFFDGSFNSKVLGFEIWEVGASNYLDYFSIQTRNLQDDYYPNLIGFEHSNGFSLEATLTYD